MSSAADRSNGIILKNYIYMLIYPYINQLKFLQKIGKQQIDKNFPVFINYFHLIALDMELK